MSRLLRDPRGADAVSSGEGDSVGSQRQEKPPYSNACGCAELYRCIPVPLKLRVNLCRRETSFTAESNFPDYFNSRTSTDTGTGLRSRARTRGRAQRMSSYLRA